MAKTHLYILKYRVAALPSLATRSVSPTSPCDDGRSTRPPGDLRDGRRHLRSTCGYWTTPSERARRSCRPRWIAWRATASTTSAAQTSTIATRPESWTPKCARRLQAVQRAWVRSAVSWPPACTSGATATDTTYRCAAPSIRGRRTCTSTFASVESTTSQERRAPVGHARADEGSPAASPRRLAWWSSSSDDAESPTHRYNLRPRAR